MASGSNTLTAFNAAANGTDQTLTIANLGGTLAGITGMRICVVGFTLSSSAGATVTFNSKGSGAGTAISGTYTMAANGGFVAPETQDWFRTNVGEALTVTASAAASVTVVYRIAP